MSAAKGETTERILEVATKMFAEKGFDGTSTKEICRAAGVNVAAIHYHFESKENLYVAVIERFGGASFEAAIRALRPAESLEEFEARLSIYLQEVIETVARQPDLAVMMVRDGQIHFEMMENIRNKTFGRPDEVLMTFLEDAIKKGIVDPSFSAVTCALGLQASIVHLISGFRVLNLRFGFDLNLPEHRQKWVRTTVQFYVHGVKRRGD